MYGEESSVEAEYLASKGLKDFEPWFLCDASSARRYSLELGRLYPNRSLRPLFKRIDNDDLACWDLDQGGISLVHLYADSGWEQRRAWPDFWAFFSSVIADFTELAKIEIEDRRSGG